MGFIGVVEQVDHVFEDEQDVEAEDQGLEGADPHHEVDTFLDKAANLKVSGDLAVYYFGVGEYEVLEYSEDLPY
jgi:hypothetical protein